MNPQSEHPDNAGDPPAAAELYDDLTQLYGQADPVPAAVDDAILSLVRQHFARRRRRTLVFSLVSAGAAAAAILLGAWLVPPMQLARETAKSRRTARPAAAWVREDIDRNGRVDILDAFGLARRLNAEGQVSTDWDFTGDGLIDRRDVDAVALAAVSLGGGS